MPVNVSITTVDDLVEHARLRLDDVPLPAAVDESALLWTTEELLHFANEAIREVAIRTLCIRDSGRDEADVTSYAVTAGENTITVDPRILRIKRVWWNDTVLVADSEKFLDECSNTWRTNTTDEPSAFVLERTSRNLQLVGVPTVDGTIKLDVVRLPLASIETGVPEIPQQYLADCLDWILHLAYLKNDADTSNPTLSAAFANMFEAKVGPRPSDLRLQLERHQSGRRRPRTYYY